MWTLDFKVSCLLALLWLISEFPILEWTPKKQSRCLTQFKNYELLMPWILFLKGLKKIVILRGAELISLPYIKYSKINPINSQVIDYEPIIFRWCRLLNGINLERNSNLVRPYGAMMRLFSAQPCGKFLCIF